MLGIVNGRWLRRILRAMRGQSGQVDTRHGRIYYEVRGDGGGVPLLVLHGGPAGGHEYMTTLGGMLGAQRRVVLYDQLGCGRSDRPDDPSLWRIERFAEEVGEVRAALGLDRVHLLGQSFGGMLAIEYMLGDPAGVVSLVLADTTASMPLAIQGLARMRAELPDDARAALDEGERTGELETPAYGQALFAYYQRHVYRLEPWPPELVAMGQSMMGNPVYLQMWGPNELTPKGNLSSLDRTDSLAGIAVPTLVTTAHPTHFAPAVARGEAWLERIGGVRPNASRKSHDGLDRAPDLDSGDPDELAQAYKALQPYLPGLAILGGCCGTDQRHVERICAEWS
jgi:proline-specific peptidase